MFMSSVLEMCSCPFGFHVYTVVSACSHGVRLASTRFVLPSLALAYGYPSSVIRLPVFRLVYHCGRVVLVAHNL